MGNAVMKGEKIYSSFFFAHPPLMLLLAPLCINIYSLRIGLLIIQCLILIVFNKILTFYVEKDTKKTLILIVLILSTSFYNFYNLYLGFGLCTLFILLSYYYYLKQKTWLSLLFANIAVATRLFAIFYVIGITIKSFRKKGIIYFSSFMLITLFIILNPLMINQVFFYHINNKESMSMTSRLMIFTSYLLFEGFLLYFSIKQRNKELILLLIMLLGVLTTRITLYMYLSMVTPLLLLSCRGLSDKQWFYVLFYFSIIFIVTPPPVFNYYDEVRAFVSNQSLPLFGDMPMINLLHYRDGFELLGGVYDASVYRFNDYSCLLNNSHLMVCRKVPNRVTNCDKINNSDYEFVGEIEEFYFLKRKL